jgi:hypothetical protein
MVFVPRAFTAERSTAECLWLWPTVFYRAAPGQDLDFAEKILQQAQRPDWEPSPGQLAYMRQLVQYYVPTGIRLDPDLVRMAEATEGKS